MGGCQPPERRAWGSILNIKDIQRRNFESETSYRLIPSHFPPLDLFEDVANPEEFEALFAIQKLTNPRIQNEVGDLSLIKPEDQVYGIAGCGFVMAAFTHLNPDGSRFSNGDFGVYYCSADLETAVAETRYHRARFYSYTKEPPQELDMRCLNADFTASLHDLLPLNTSSEPIYDADNYTASQQLAIDLKVNNNDGLVYHSVRHTSGINYALLKPKLIHRCRQSLHLTYVWDGSKISDIYQKTRVC